LLPKTPKPHYNEAKKELIRKLLDLIYHEGGKFLDIGSLFLDKLHDSTDTTGSDA
jgi:hypothetical protein